MSTDRKGFTMKARSLIVAAAATAALALAGTASADVYSAKPGDYFSGKPGDVYGHNPAGSTWSGVHVAGTKWGHRTNASAGWTRAQL
jgi:hypothetical protein